MTDNKVKGKAEGIKGIMDGLEDNKEESKSSKEEKIKRSFTLTESQVEKIYLLKAKNNSMTLSEIVGNAIEEYYDQSN